MDGSPMAARLFARDLTSGRIAISDNLTMRYGTLDQMLELSKDRIRHPRPDLLDEDDEQADD
jgi:hypothetical protein